jgi:hypothetical protein
LVAQTVAAGRRNPPVSFASPPHSIHHFAFCILHSAFVRTYRKNVLVPLPYIVGICRCVGSSGPPSARHLTS